MMRQTSAGLKGYETYRRRTGPAGLQTKQTETVNSITSPIVYNIFTETELMKTSHKLLLLGLTAAAGSATAVLADRKHPARAGLIGAASGFAAGLCAAVIYSRSGANGDVPYYSSSSPQYTDIDTV